jgi:uncharacterized repeat protein (TIGR01451 family)/LPXTG-motif cell wall-anchored protein
MTRTWTQTDGMRFLYLAIAFTVAFAALTVLPAPGAARADATPDYSGIGSNFEIDGDTDVDNGDGVDWETPPDTVVHANEVCGIPNADDIIVPSTKLFDPSWPIELNAKAVPKGDLCDAAVAWENIDGQIYLYFSWTRFAATGEVSVYIPLDGGLAGYDDDVLLSFDQDSSAKTIGFEILEWDGSNWQVIPTPSGAVNADIDEATGKFAEAAVNLSALGIISEVSCDSVAITRLVTETGEGVHSDPTLKDNVGFGNIPLANCGRIIVEKETVGGDDDFGFTTSYDNDGFTLSNGESDNSGLMFPDTYSVSETTLPDGWVQTSASCDDGSDPSSIDLAAGTTVTCTFVNETLPTLTLVKSVDNGDGGDAVAADWTLTANDGGDGADLSGAGGDSGDVMANVAYALGESAGPDGYSAGDWSCDGGTQDGASITLGLEDDVTCTIINDDLPSSITVVKEFENETDVDPDAFLLTVTEGDAVTAVLSGEANAFDANFTYTIGETVLDGWTQTSLVCRLGEESIGNDFELGLNEHVVCTITNGENPTVTVNKVTDIETEDLFDFYLDQDKQSVASGGSYTWEDLTPGDYSLTEVLTSAAWALEGYECDVEAEDLGNGVGFGLSYGDHVTCEFGNEIVPIDIQVEKSDRVDPIVLDDDNPVGLIEYDIVVTNNGPAADPGVALVDTLPLSLTFVSVATDTGTCDYVLADHTIECDFGAMDVDDVVNVYVVMETETLGSVTDIFPLNTATVTGVRDDFDLSNNTDDEVTTIIEVEALCDEDDDDPECLPETGADIAGPVAAGLVFLLLGSLLAVLARKRDEDGATS